MKSPLEVFLQFRRAKVTDREWMAACYRWEFLRLNPKYKRDYKQSNKNVLPQYHPKWGIGEWLDPDLSFDELYKRTRRTVSKEDDAKWLTILKIRLPSEAATMHASRLDIEGNAIEDSGFDLRINPNNHSDAEILEKVKNLLLVFRGKKNKTRLRWDWKTLPKYLQAVTLHYQQGMSANEISKILFPPPDPYSDDESIPETDDGSAIRETRRYLDIGKRLVEGEYKDIA